MAYRGESGAIDEVARDGSASRTQGRAVEATVQPRDGPQEIGERLEELGVIDSATQFRVLVALLGYDRLLQAGDYEFAAGTPALEVVYRMRSGVLSAHTKTVVEGWRLEEIADAVAARGIPRADFLAAARSRDYQFDFLKEIPAGQSLEGHLYPATYGIKTTDTAGRRREDVGGVR